MKETILVVEDEVKIARLVRDYLENAGYRVLTAHRGDEGLALARSERPDLIILDLMLPGLDGLDLCRTVRRDSQVPVIMLTARADEADRLIGLELGADDYIVKPFSPREVVARVRAVLRRARGGEPEPEALRYEDLELDVAGHTAAVAGRPVELTPTEFALLAAMMRAPGRVFSRLQLLDQVQGEAYEGYERTIDAHIKNLRQKIEADPRSPRYIVTVYGVGYKLSA
ncbi:MAG TPA: response regulator transcription factor [Anaerolineae bacterium]|nr:response regulator transcription factor [Anaerolineae bacterium]HOQ99931.1 response regulator transcription factor [Anaerolineae bacterium]HPL26840.1 response regulator transcription factor [Anaerolineae bacterium]